MGVRPCGMLRSVPPSLNLSGKGCSEDPRMMRATWACEQRGVEATRVPGGARSWPKACVGPSLMTTGGVGLL